MTAQMEREESAKRLNENLHRAISRCEELAIALKQPLFTKWAQSIRGIRFQTKSMANAKSRTKIEIEADINKFCGNLAAKQEKQKIVM